jgi:hypothetical protein
VAAVFVGESGGFVVVAELGGDRLEPTEGDNVTVSLTCKHCQVTIGADDESELATRVQEHTRMHDRDPRLTPEHIRAHLRRVQRTDREAKDC